MNKRQRKKFHKKFRHRTYSKLKHDMLYTTCLPFVIPGTRKMYRLRFKKLRKKDDETLIREGIVNSSMSGNEPNHSSIPSDLAILNTYRRNKLLLKALTNELRSGYVPKEYNLHDNHEEFFAYNYEKCINQALIGTRFICKNANMDDHTFKCVIGERPILK